VAQPPAPTTTGRGLGGRELVFAPVDAVLGGRPGDGFVQMIKGLACGGL